MTKMQAHNNYKSAVKIKDDITYNIRNNGFSRISVCDYCFSSNFIDSFDKIKKYSSNLPVDNYGPNSNRKRIYGRYVLVPWEESENNLISTPGRLYSFNNKFGLSFCQPKIINEDSPGERRVFDVFPNEIYQNMALKDLIRTIFYRLPFEKDISDFPFQVGVHLIKLEAGPNSKAVASPNKVHCDGEPYTVAILVDRENAIGGYNVITERKWHNHSIDFVPESGIKEKFTLENTLDGYIVSDDMVAHYVSPIMPEIPDKTGIRTILLLDYTPLRPELRLSDLM